MKFGKTQNLMSTVFHFQVIPLKRLHNMAQPKYATYIRSDPLPHALQLEVVNILKFNWQGVFIISLIYS